MVAWPGIQGNVSKVRGNAVSQLATKVRELVERRAARLIVVAALGADERGVAALRVSPVRYKGLEIYCIAHHSYECSASRCKLYVSTLIIQTSV